MANEDAVRNLWLTATGVYEIAVELGYTVHPDSTVTTPRGVVSFDGEQRKVTLDGEPITNVMRVDRYQKEARSMVLEALGLEKVDGKVQEKSTSSKLEV